MQKKKSEKVKLLHLSVGILLASETLA